MSHICDLPQPPIAARYTTSDLWWCYYREDVQAIYWSWSETSRDQSACGIEGWIDLLGVDFAKLGTHIQPMSSSRSKSACTGTPCSYCAVTTWAGTPCSYSTVVTVSLLMMLFLAQTLAFVFSTWVLKWDNGLGWRLGTLDGGSFWVEYPTKLCLTGSWFHGCEGGMHTLEF